MTESNPVFTRRRLLASGVGLAGAIALMETGLSGVAAANPASSTVWSSRKSANGWPIIEHAAAHQIEGSNVSVTLASGIASTVLLHVARRFHYEVSALKSDQPQEITGHSTSRVVSQPYESNYLSGTAIAIRPDAYPPGASGGYFPAELATIRDILAECEGTIRWGGDLPVPKEGHFHIDVPPTDKVLRSVAKKIDKWNRTNGAITGAVDIRMPERANAAQALARQQRTS